MWFASELERNLNCLSYAHLGLMSLDVPEG